MEELKQATKRTGNKISMKVDLTAKLTGFDSAKTPTRAHHKIAKNFSSVFMLGPQNCEPLLEMVMHMFDEEEANVAQHLLPMLPLTAAQLARRCRVSTDEIEPILYNLTENKRVILSFGKTKRYTILPLIPGTFEMVIVSPDLSRNNHWHKRFAELFEEVWDTEYMRDYLVPIAPLVRYLPTQGNASKLQSACPTEKLEEMLEPYDDFAVAHCQCRVATSLADRGCGKPTENCVMMGPMAKKVIEKGVMRRIDKEEVIAVKKLAEEHGCITWMINGQNAKEGNNSCSCCGCCCHALRTITQLNMPSIFSPPRYIPKRIYAKCTSCGVCAIVCPMGAWKKTGGEAPVYDFQRCIGCGICVTSCKFGALELVAAPEQPVPEKNFSSLLLKTAPTFAAHTFRLWLKRNIGI